MVCGQCPPYGTRMGVVSDVPGNPRPISQVGDPKLNSTGEIVPTRSSALATIPHDGKLYAFPQIENSDGSPYGWENIAQYEEFLSHFTSVRDITRRSGVVGGHNHKNFTDYAANTIVNTEAHIVLNRVRIDNTIESKITPGLYQSKYSILIGSQQKGLFSNNYIQIDSPKTTYDPAKIGFTDTQMIEMSKQAAMSGYDQAIANNIRWYDSTVDGIKFRTYIKNSYVDNIHPLFE
jgi:hypothetical protein